MEKGRFSGIAVSAPSKMILHGEHSVVYGKMALAGSLNLRTRMTLEPHPSKDTLEVDFPDISIHRVWSKEEIEDNVMKYCRQDILQSLELDEEFLAKIRLFLTKDLDDLALASLMCFFYLYSPICLPFLSLKIKVESEIPIGAGLGSSAALSVCLSAGLLHVVRGEAPFPRPISREEISELAFLSEKVIHGTPSGVDNSVSTFGGIIQFQSGTITKVKDVPQLRIVLVNTKVLRKTKVLVDLVRNQLVRMPSVVMPIMESMDAISKESVQLLQKLVQQNHDKELYEELNSLLDYNQKLLEVLRVSHPSLEAIVSIAKRHGLYAKLTGAGGGGFAFVLIPPDTEEEVVTSLKTDLECQGFTSWETTFGVDGILVQNLR